MFRNSGYYFLGLTAAAIAAFWPRYLSRDPRGIDAYTHLHAFSMLAWSLLLIAQPFLIRARRRSAHRVLGLLSCALAALVMVSSLLLAHLRFASMSPLVFLAEAKNLYLPVSTVVLFGTAYGMGLYYRRVPSLHAAFMVGTALTMIDPILGRIIGFYFPPLPNDLLYQAITYGTTDLILLGLILARRTDAQSRWALATMLKIFVPVHALWFTLAQSAAWMPFARWFRSLPLT